MRYPGDIKMEKVTKMTPKSITKAMEILKKACESKDKTIKRLQTKHQYQKKRIESLENLISTLQKKGLVSSDFSAIIQVK